MRQSPGSAGKNVPTSWIGTAESDKKPTLNVVSSQALRLLLLLGYRLFVSVAEPVEGRLVETPPYELQAHRKS